MFIRHVNNMVCGRYLFRLYPLLEHSDQTQNGFLAVLTLLSKFCIQMDVHLLSGEENLPFSPDLSLLLLDLLTGLRHTIWCIVCLLPILCHFSPVEIWVVKVSSEYLPKHPEGCWPGHLENGKATGRNEAVVSSTVCLHSLWSFMQSRQPCL